MTRDDATRRQGDQMLVTKMPRLLHKQTLHTREATYMHSTETQQAPMSSRSNIKETQGEALTCTTARNTEIQCPGLILPYMIQERQPHKTATPKSKIQTGKMQQPPQL